MLNPFHFACTGLRFSVKENKAGKRPCLQQLMRICLENVNACLYELVSLVGSLIDVMKYEKKSTDDVLGN